jgi:hypothetical protein
VIDGALAAANVDTVDMTLPVQTRAGVRQFLDKVLRIDAKDWTPVGASQKDVWPSGTMTGMLIRSELVARWPDMLVRAYSTPPQEGSDVSPGGDITILRKDTLAKNIMIILFAGVPREIRIREPHVGERFGVVDRDPTTDGGPYKVSALPAKEQTGFLLPENGDVLIQLRGDRVIDIDGLRSAIAGSQQVFGSPFVTIGPRLIALHLLRLAYVQRFLDPAFFGDPQLGYPGVFNPKGVQPDEHLVGSKASVDPTTAQPAMIKLMNGKIIPFNPFTV